MVLGIKLDPQSKGLLDGLIRRKEKKPLPREVLEPVYGPENEASNSPWDAWELDEGFFVTLSRWTLDHPETALDRILERMSNAIAASQDFFELIPDQPFPARGLVTAIAHLFTLGVTISHAAAEVYEFGKNILRWVIRVKSAFDSKPGQFSRTTWKNLGDMRELIDEICRWAKTRLKDSRWLRFQKGLTIDRDLSEFRERISETRNLFIDLSVISLSTGLDAFMQDVHRSFFKQESTIIIEIQKIKTLQSRQLDSMATEMKIQQEALERRQFLSETLVPHTVENATYVLQGKRPCDQGTRIEILNEIMTWIRDVSPGSPNFLWLTGEPGCGKSAITAHITRECGDHQMLWAQLFINRKDEKTTKPRHYFPTIVRQLSDHSSVVQKAVYEILDNRPSLMDGMSADQATELFVGAVRVACSLAQKSPVVVIIDALDETDRRHLYETATIISRLFEMLKDYPNAKIFISSRTEDDITSPFNKTIKDNCVKHIHLDTSTQSSINDVGTYLRRRLVEIVEKNELDWSIWPGDERMKALISQASGLFIWAVTAADFLQQQIDFMGTECLDDVLNLLNSQGMVDIYTLYHVILEFIYTPPSDWEYEKFRRIVGAIIVLREPASLADLSGILDLRRSPKSAPVDMVKFARRLRTVLVTGVETINLRTIPRVHKSFLDFITSENVNKNFQIDYERVRMELAHQPIGLPSQLDSFRRYCSRWDSTDGWLESNRADLLSYISTQETLTSDDKAFCADFVRKVPIYQRAAVCVYELLKRETDRTIGARQLAKLLKFMQAWATWNITEAISQHRLIHNSLCTLTDWDSAKYSSLHVLDTDAICVHLYLVFHDYNQYQKLINLPHTQAQVIVDFLQSMLDSPYLDAIFRTSFLNTLIKISKETGLFPEGLRTHDIILDTIGPIAVGAFKDIWTGTSNNQKVAVAVRRIYPTTDVAQLTKEFSREALIWWQLRHVNVISLVSLYSRSIGGRTIPGLVSPWEKNGTINQYLQHHPNTNRLYLIRDISEGVKYLHNMQPTIVHGDLKHENILITDNGRACLAGFGLASVCGWEDPIDHSESESAAPGGTIRFTAPELLAHDWEDDLLTYSPSTDIYAFGCVLYQIFSGTPPFYEVKNDHAVLLKVIKGKRPQRPTHSDPSGISCEELGLDDRMWNLIEECWHQEPLMRPTMNQVIARLPERSTSTT